ncbi:hypothetical protein SDJN02_14315, partial [Cucurbita argyrosperma subsp. argyrosperma]
MAQKAFCMRQSRSWTDYRGNVYDIVLDVEQSIGGKQRVSGHTILNNEMGKGINPHAPPTACKPKAYSHS